MGKVGTWTYWFKADDFDLNFVKHKRQIPKGRDFVQSMRVYKPDGNIDYELIHNGKTEWIKRNINKLTDCEKAQMSYEIQREMHKILSVDFPKKEYKTIMEKQFKGCKIKK